MPRPLSQASRMSALALAIALALAGCAGTPTGSVADRGGISLPPTTGGFDYQLGGGYPPPDGVTVVTRDSTDSPATGLYSICYVNGFQTQPGAVWPSSLIVRDTSGDPLVDPGWPDEHIIDISTAANREQAASRIGTVVDDCAAKGFDAIEFDNLDSYSRSNGALTLDNAIAFAQLLVARAHAAGLAASQKNTGELGAKGKNAIGFDFATTEECDRYSECDAFTDVYGARVYDVEYIDDLRDSFPAVCGRSDRPPLTTLRDRQLVTPQHADYVFERC